MAGPGPLRIRDTNEALTGLTRTVNEQYALHLALLRQNGADSTHLRRIANEITMFNQRLRVHLSFDLNISAPGVNHQFLPIEVDEYVESLVRVDIDSLGTEEEEYPTCDICKESFGQPRGSCSPPFIITPSTTTSPASTQHVVKEPESESGQPVKAATNPTNAAEMNEDERPESPVKLECGHIFGEICLRKWISEGNPPTCPMCRNVLNGSERGERDAVRLEVRSYL